MAGSQYNTTQCVALRCVAFVLMLVVMQCNARIDSDRIDPCVPLRCILVSDCQKNRYCVLQINAMQGLALLYEPAFRL